MKIKNILVSQPKPTSEKSPYFDIAEKYNVHIDFKPFIQVEGLPLQEFRSQRIEVLDYTAVIFTARTAIDHFFRLCEEMRITIPETMKYFCVSENIALYLQKFIKYRKRKVFFAESGKWEDLVQIMAKHKTENYLFPQSDVHSDEVHQMLEAKKLKHTECVMYRTVSNDLPTDKPLDFDMVVLFTPAGVDSLLKNIPDFKDRNIKLACYGKATAKAIQDAGLPLELEAPLVKAPSITGSLSLYLEENNK